MNNPDSFQGGAVVTRDQLNLAKKLAYYETEVDKAKQELSAYNSKKDNTVSVQILVSTVK